MIETYIKHFTLMICSFYVYLKLLNLKPSEKYIITGLAYAALFTVLLAYLRQYFPPLMVPAMFALSLLYSTLATKTKLELSITTTVLSFGIVYAVFAVSVLLISVIFKLTHIAFSSHNLFIGCLCASLTQLLLIGIPFRFRRLKSGMPFLRSKGAGNTGVIISVVLLCCVLLVSNSQTAALIYIIPVVLILICGVLILFWWRSRLKKAYIDKLRDEEILSLEETLREKEDRIHDLEQHNEALAKIIHKDNKLIPAMEFAVKDFLNCSGLKTSTQLRDQGNALLIQLEALAKERSGIIRNYQNANKKMPHTDIRSTNALLTYMFHKAKEKNVDFEFTVFGSVKYLEENIIPASDLNTLLADLIENAIIAAENTTNGKVFVSIGITDEYYRIDCLDSGIPFDARTIVQLGNEKVTTHADNGGSGIGLITLFEILDNYHASLMIEEFSNENSAFTKKVSVLFDNLHQFLVKTPRSNELTAISHRDDLIIMTAGQPQIQ